LGIFQSVLAYENAAEYPPAFVYDAGGVFHAQAKIHPLLFDTDRWVDAAEGSVRVGGYALLKRVDGSGYH